MNTTPFFTALLLLATLLPARAEQISSGGYDFSVRARQRGERLHLDGRVTSTRACPALAVTAYVQDDRGRRERIPAVVTGLAGWGSKLVEGGPLEVAAPAGAWEVYRLDARCRQ